MQTYIVIQSRKVAQKFLLFKNLFGEICSTCRCQMSGPTENMFPKDSMSEYPFEMFPRFGNITLK